jgi:hypothetical protein
LLSHTLTRDTLLADLHAILQETNPARTLDSVEAVTVRAYLAKHGIEYPEGTPLPETLGGWVEWAVRSSMVS